MNAFSIRKQFDGRYRWYGSPTNNALDRDAEILSGASLEDVVKRIKSSGQFPPLYFFHVRYPMGTTDYMYYTDGIVHATGLINDEPVAKAAAEYAITHPDSIDGSGWAMSHEFSGYRDKGGVFHHIGGINELTFLSRFMAANPYTSFGVGVKAMDEQQRKALDIVLGNPALVAVVEQHVAAQSKSKSLDAQGVVRKTASNAATSKTLGNHTTPLSLFLKADEPPIEEEEEQKDDMMYEEEVQAEAEATPAPDSVLVPEATAAPSGDVATAIAEQIAAPIAEAVSAGVEAIAETASVFTPEQQQQIVDLVNAAVAPMQSAMQEMATALTQARSSAESEVKSLKSQVDELTGVKVRNEVPKMTLVDIWKQRPSTSPATVIQEGDPVANKGLQLPDAPQVQDMWSSFGFAAKEA